MFPPCWLVSQPHSGNILQWGVILYYLVSISCRDEAQGKMMALKEKADKDLSQYNTELKELMRIIEHDRKLKEFMRVKSEERAEMMEGELSSQRKKKDEKERGDKAEETIEVHITC